MDNTRKAITYDYRVQYVFPHGVLSFRVARVDEGERLYLKIVVDSAHNAQA